MNETLIVIAIGCVAGAVVFVQVFIDLGNAEKAIALHRHLLERYGERLDRMEMELKRLRR